MGFLLLPYKSSSKMYFIYSKNREKGKRGRLHLLAHSTVAAMLGSQELHPSPPGVCRDPSTWSMLCRLISMELDRK